MILLALFYLALTFDVCFGPLIINPGMLPLLPALGMAKAGVNPRTPKSANGRMRIGIKGKTGEKSGDVGTGKIMQAIATCLLQRES